MTNVAASPSRGSSRLLITQVSKLPDWASGEAWVVADARKPQRLAAVWTSLPSTPTAAVTTPPGPHPIQCGVGYSTDGGKTWVEGTMPFQSVNLPTNPGGCADPTLVAAPEGILYSLFNGGSATPGAGTTTPRPPNLASLSHSRDGGRTWSDPTKVWFFDETPKNTVATGSPDLAFDRGWLVIDQVTSTMYASLSDDALVQRVVLASHDHGVTWGTAYPLEPDGQSVWGDVPSASHGVLAAAYALDPNSLTYQASSSPAVKCDQVCAVFQTSTDDGKTWARTVMPVRGLAVESAGVGSSGLKVAADPSAKERYAVLVPKTSNSLEAWLTRDRGATWKRTLRINAPADDTLRNEWIAYGPKGVLGVVWRHVYPDNSHDVFAAISINSGKTFGPKIDLVPGRARPDDTPDRVPGDDCACNLHLNSKYLYTTWGDSRSGQQQVWFARYRYAN